jgi:hypothetical protein
VGSAVRPDEGLPLHPPHTGGVSEHPLAVAAALAGVSDPRVLDAVASVPRADFVPPELAAAAERDKPIPRSQRHVRGCPVRNTSTHVITGNTCSRDEMRRASSVRNPRTRGPAELVGIGCTYAECKQLARFL